jgi:hypothetical protein
MCAAIDCPAGTTCYPGRGCVGDPCVGVRCPVDRVCEVVERGEAQCRYRDPSAIPRGATFVRAEGGGGFCAVSAAGPGGGGRDAAAGLAAAGAIAVAAGALRRRRRRAGRRAGRSGGVSEPSRGSRGGAR